MPFPTVAYWAQSQDNVSPDHLEWEGATLVKGNSRREAVQSAVFEVTKGGTELSLEGASRVVMNGDRYLIQTVGKDRDEAGRLAPLVVVGTIPDDEDGWARGVVEGAARFLRSIRRDASEARLAQIRDGLVTLSTQKKKRAQARRTAVWFGAAALLVAGYVAYQTLSANSERPPNQQEAPRPPGR